MDYLEYKGYKGSVEYRKKIIVFAVRCKELVIRL